MNLDFSGWSFMSCSSVQFSIRVSSSSNVALVVVDTGCVQPLHQHKNATYNFREQHYKPTRFEISMVDISSMNVNRSSKSSNCKQKTHKGYF